MPEARILLGVIGRPHGVRGLVHVQSYTAEPADLAAYGPLLDESGRRWTLAWRGAGVAELRDAEGLACTDRDAAAKLTNTRLYIERGRLPPADEDEFYLSDLVGMRAVDEAGAPLGQVTIVHDYGAGPSLEIAGQGPPLLVPFTRTCVPTVDIAAGYVAVVRPDEVEHQASEAPSDGHGPDMGRPARHVAPQRAPAATEGVDGRPSPTMTDVSGRPP